MYKCSACKQSFLKWAGKCPHCSEWNTLEIDENQSSWGGKKAKKSLGTARVTERLLKDGNFQINRKTSKSTELDTVFGGWIVPWSLILLSGEPWIGKSTLSLQMADWYGTEATPVLYVTGEEHIGQISWRAERLQIQNESIRVLATSVFEDILATIQEWDEDVVIIDSISVLGSELLEWASGSISQIRVITEAFMECAKKTKKAIILIGHVTKDGAIGGPKTLEHLVDVVLFLEWSRTESYRILRSHKNRFGSTDVVGIFRMTEHGLIDLPNPWMEFIDAENMKLAGSALTMAMEWNRPILIEVEALTTYTKFWYPKRSSRGIFQWKADLLLAVLTKYTNTKLDSYDVYINIGRWMSIHEPGIDVACIAAMIGSRRWKSYGKSLFLWEVSLTWVVKNVSMMERRIQEAAKLWFDMLYIPSRYEWKIPNGVQVARFDTVGALEKMLVGNIRDASDEE